MIPVVGISTYNANKYEIYMFESILTVASKFRLFAGVDCHDNNHLRGGHDVISLYITQAPGK